jgi:hypothetical protein
MLITRKAHYQDDRHRFPDTPESDVDGYAYGFPSGRGAGRRKNTHGETSPAPLSANAAEHLALAKTVCNNPDSEVGAHCFFLDQVC